MKPINKLAIRAQNVKNGGLVFKNLKYISKNVSNSLVRSKLFKNELVMTFIGAGIGECSIIDENNKYHLAPNVAKITIKDETKIDPYYFWYHIKSDFVQNQIREITRTAAQPSLSMGIIRNINVMIPSIKIQKQIVMQVESEMDALEKVSELKKQAEERINKILEEVWGE